MWGLETIREINSIQSPPKPYRLTLSGLEGVPPFPFPHLGYACEDVDAEHLASLFCDTSGFGAPNEPALTSDQLVAKLRELLEVHSVLLVAIGEQGQFQAHIEVWAGGEPGDSAG